MDYSGLTNGVGTAGLLVLLFWMLATGRLCTGRELREKNDRIAVLEKMIETRDAQHSLMLTETMPAVTNVLTALHEAAEEAGSP